MSSKPWSLVNSRTRAIWEGHRFDRNTGNLSSCRRWILWTGKPWRSERVTLDNSWDTDEMVHPEEIYSGSSSHGLSEGRRLHVSLARPSLVLHLPWCDHRPKWCAGTITKGDTLQDWPTNQAGRRDAGGANCLRKKNLLKIPTASEIVRHYELTCNSKNCN